MAGGEDPADIPPLKGLSKYFNSYTNQGRFNTVIMTYVGCFLLYLYVKNKPKKEPKKKE